MLDLGVLAYGCIALWIDLLMVPVLDKIREMSESFVYTGIDVDTVSISVSLSSLGKYAGRSDRCTVLFSIEDNVLSNDSESPMIAVLY